jgi:hypothetical protein
MKTTLVQWNRRTLQRARGLRVIGLATWLLALPVDYAADPPPLSERDLQGQMRVLQETTNETDRARKARELTTAYRLSSHQVKVIARTIPGEDARIEFALAAYPFTADPQNFYEVYDVFESFSKVFRLHDQLVRLRAQPSPPSPGPVPPVVTGPPPLGDVDLAEILKAVKRENFDDNKLAVARQITTSAKGRIASRQVADILKLFTFDDRRLDLAKSAYDCVLDPWNYHLVYETFKFSSNRETLSEYIQSRTPAR